MTAEYKFKKRCFTFVKTFCQKIDYEKLKKADFALSNSACHCNAVAAYNAGRADSVWLVWGGGKNGCIHFINSKNGTFFDETWHDYNRQDYYIIRKVKQSEFEDIYDLLCDTKRMFYDLHGGLIAKVKAKINIHGWI